MVYIHYLLKLLCTSCIDFNTVWFCCTMGNLVMYVLCCKLSFNNNCTIFAILWPIFCLADDNSGDETWCQRRTQQQQPFHCAADAARGACQSPHCWLLINATVCRLCWSRYKSVSFTTDRQTVAGFLLLLLLFLLLLLAADSDSFPPPTNGRRRNGVLDRSRFSWPNESRRRGGLTTRSTACPAMRRRITNSRQAIWRLRNVA